MFAFFAKFFFLEILTDFQKVVQMKRLLPCVHQFSASIF